MNECSPTDPTKGCAVRHASVQSGRFWPSEDGWYYMPTSYRLNGPFAVCPFCGGDLPKMTLPMLKATDGWEGEDGG